MSTLQLKVFCKNVKRCLLILLICDMSIVQIVVMLFVWRG